MFFECSWSDYSRWISDCFLKPLDERWYFEWDDIAYLLNNIEFTWNNPKDSNRAEDGIFYVRKDYFEKEGWSNIDFDKRCSVLEMIVGLAIRMNKEYVGYSDEFMVFEILIFMFRNMEIQPTTEARIIEERIINWLKKKKNHYDIFIKPREMGWDEWDELEIWRKMTKNLHYFQ